MKTFRFQKFDILQNESVFRVGTDAVLLGTLANCSSSFNVLEVGTGTGVISLMLAQRNSKSNILAIDIDENAVELAQQNFSNSIFNDRLSVKHLDFLSFDDNIKFDLIISNPPFFEKNNSKKDVFARQQITLSYQNLISKSSYFLSENGILSVIIPSDDETFFTELSNKNNLFLIRKVEVFGNISSQRKRVVLEFSKTLQPLVIEKLIIEKSPRIFSDQYLELTKEFHVFKK